MEENNLTSALATDTGVGREFVCRPELLRDMAGRRRAWTVEQKVAIVAEMERCDNISAFARQHDIRISLLYTWRRELRYALEARQLSRVASDAEPMFVPVVADSPKPIANDIAIEVEVGGARTDSANRADGRGAQGSAGAAMIGIGPDTRIMLATRPVDFRRIRTQ